MATQSMLRALLLTGTVCVGGIFYSSATRSEPPESSSTAPAKEIPKREPIYDVDADGGDLIAAAVLRAKRERKHVLIEWGGNWCGWCHKLHDVFKTDDLVSPIVAEQYVLVLVDCAANRELMEHYGGKDTRYAFPHLTILDADGELLTNQETGSLEIGPKHDPKKVAKFLETWQRKRAAPTSNATAAADDSEDESEADDQAAAATAGSAPQGDEEETVERGPKQVPTTGSMLVCVVGPKGQPIAGAKLFANVTSWDRRAVGADNAWGVKNDNYISGADGTVKIKLPLLVEDLRLWVHHDGYAPMFAIWWPKQDPDLTAIPEVFTYHMQTGTIMGGTIKNDNGDPIAGAKVEAMCNANAPQLGRNSGATLDTWIAYGDNGVTTDADGRWQLTNVPPGDDVKVRIKLSHSDYIGDSDWGQLQNEQHVNASALREETAVIVMHRGILVMGTVTDPEGAPVKDAVVVRGDHPYWEEGSQEVRTDAQGVYRFPPLPVGPMHVTIVAQGWMPERTKVEIAPDMRSTDFTLKRGKKLRLRFVDAAGSPVPKVLATVDKWQGAESLYNLKHSNVLDTNIPRLSDENGIYEWTWAPDSPVEFQFGKEGFAEAKSSITADDTEQVITLSRPLKFAGTVVDADSGQAIEKFTAVPTIHFREDFPLVLYGQAVHYHNGKFLTELDRADVKHSLQIEAPGYATVRTRTYSVGAEVPPLNLRMKPAPRFTGRVVDELGRGVANARIYVGSYSQHLDLSDFEKEDGGRPSHYRVTADGQGKFEIAHQLERYALVIVSDKGYGEVDRPIGALPGVVKLRPWATVKGKLSQGTDPVGDWNVRLTLIRDQGGDAPRGNISIVAQTADDGSFVFKRIPPVACRVQAYIHFSVNGPLSSSRSVPLVPAPGEEIRVSLGGGGAEVTGKLALDPPIAGFDYHFAINYLVARRPGITPPPFVAKKGFNWRQGWSDAWANSQEGGAYLQTLHHYFVKPDPDGRVRISGVEPGEYELALHLYGSTEGCLVHPVGVAVVRVTVPEGKSAVDLGTIKVPALPGLKVGDDSPAFEFTADGKRQTLADARGKYVLIDFWATWCGPCVQKIPDVENLRQKYADRPGLVVIGANLDQDTRRAAEFLREKKLPWRHALLGDWSSTDVPQRFAISSVPSYVLIGPDGHVLAHEISLDAIGVLLDTAASR